MWTLIVESYEPSHRYPIVVHHFSGDTKQEAEGYYQAHLKSDAFLRQCMATGMFQGKVPCPSRVRWERPLRGG